MRHAHNSEFSTTQALLKKELLLLQALHVTEASIAAQGYAVMTRHRWTKTEMTDAQNEVQHKLFMTQRDFTCPPSADMESVISAPSSVSTICVEGSAFSACPASSFCCCRADSAEAVTAFCVLLTAMSSWRPSSRRCCAAYSTQMAVLTALANRLVQNVVLSMYSSTSRMTARGVYAIQMAGWLMTSFRTCGCWAASCDSGLS